jgi:tetratricopeptide (TPR) repeat protein
MRRTAYHILCVTVLLAVLAPGARPVFGQEAGPPRRSAHYEISGGNDGAGGAAEAVERIAADLERRFDVFTRLFRFNDQALKDRPLRVRLIAGKDAYDDYVGGILGEKREGAVYIHYRREERRELVINYGGRGPLPRTLPYQAFIQYLRAFVPQPPSWIQKGFAIYFSGLSFSEGGKIDYRENLSWLDRAKAAPAPVRAILLADAATDAATDAVTDAAEGGPGKEFAGTRFDALSWSLASFFLHSGNEDYFRTLLECFMLLSRDADAAENSLILEWRIEEWNGLENLDRDYRAYLDSRRSFSELMDRGQRAWLSGEGGTARSLFLEARDQRPDSYAPRYYLGLLAYGEGNWGEAEGYYLQSLERGAGEAPVSYALGLNAAAALQRDKAAEYLNRAAALAPERYREKADRILRILSAK